MMRMRERFGNLTVCKWAIGVVCGVFLVATPVCAREFAGRSGAPFLLINPDARSGALAGAGVSYLDDAAGMSLNPALLGLRDRSQAQALYSERFAGIEYNYLGFALPVFERDNVGFNLVTLRGEDTRREAPGIIVGSFDVTDLALSAGYSRYITRNFVAGGTLKLIRREIESVSSTAFGVDAGVLYRDVVPGLNVGGSIQNFGTELDFEQESFDQPLTLRVGGSYEFDRVALLVDFNKSSERSLRVNVGSEWKVGEVLRLRGGYKIGNDFGGADDFTVGFGLKYGIFSVDYGYEQFDELGDVHRIQTSIEWGKVREPVETVKIPQEEVRFEPTEEQKEYLEEKKGIRFRFKLYHKGTEPLLKSRDQMWAQGVIDKVFRQTMESYGIVALTDDPAASVLMTEIRYFIKDETLKIVGYVWDSEKPDAILRVEKEGSMRNFYDLSSSISEEMNRRIFGPLFGKNHRKDYK